VAASLTATPESVLPGATVSLSMSNFGAVEAPALFPTRCPFRGNWRKAPMSFGPRVSPRARAQRIRSR
jgi:hypothetical protein